MVARKKATSSSQSSASRPAAYTKPLQKLVDETRSFGRLPKSKRGHSAADRYERNLHVRLYRQKVAARKKGTVTTSALSHVEVQPRGRHLAETTEHQSFQIVLGWLWERYNTVCNLCKYEEKCIPTWVEEALAECTACKEGSECVFMKNHYAQRQSKHMAPEAFPIASPIVVPSPEAFTRGIHQLVHSKLLELTKDEQQEVLSKLLEGACSKIPYLQTFIYCLGAQMSCAVFMIWAHWLEPHFPKHMFFDQHMIHMILDQQSHFTTDFVVKFLLEAFKSMCPSEESRETLIQWLYENIIKNPQAIIEDKQFGQYIYGTRSAQGPAGRVHCPDSGQVQ